MKRKMSSLKLAAVLFISVYGSASWAGNFSYTCSDSTIEGSTLSSTCAKMDGSPNATSIDLNPYIENVDGTLVWQPDNFIATCRSTSLSDGHILDAECQKMDQSWMSTSIDLDEQIDNTDGTLMYK